MHNKLVVSLNNFIYFYIVLCSDCTGRSRIDVWCG